MLSSAKNCKSFVAYDLRNVKHDSSNNPQPAVPDYVDVAGAPNRTGRVGQPQYEVIALGRRQ